jgi:glycosyltransferase involved in cell wall biosynthesis
MIILQPKISVAIPIHSMNRADYFLNRVLESIVDQTYQDFEVVITDNSNDDILERIVRTYAMPIVYHRNPIKGMAQNTNEAIKRSVGRLIKILYMDDLFAHKDALKDIVEHFKGHWLITATDNNRHPRYTSNIHTGNNHLGSPSALTILNEKPLMFDEKLTWLLDCAYYREMYDKYGAPVILKKVNVMIGTHPGQMTHLISDERKKWEEDYLKEKYD